MNILELETTKKLTDRAKNLFEYCIYAVVIGAAVGFAGACLGKAISFASNLRSEHEWLICFMPLAGLLIIWLYHLAGVYESLGTNRILSSLKHKDDGLSLRVAPLIFVSTVLTHLTGGSAGRESAALQLGASLADYIGRHLKLSHEDMRVITMCGMASGFTALFGTPLAASVFALEILANKIRYAALLPVFLSSISAKVFSGFFGAETERYALSLSPELSPALIIRLFAAGILAAFLSMLMCIALDETHILYGKIKNPYLRVFIGGVITACLTMLFGPATYAGAGGHIIAQAIEGNAPAFAFLIKILLTALTLGCGFKGGEIVPTLFVGAAFGAVVGPFIGLDPGFCAALCMIGNFAGNTNCPLAAIALSVELFGGECAACFALVVFLSYTLSGHYSLYAEQKLMKSRFSID